MKDLKEAIYKALEYGYIGYDQDGDQVFIMHIQNAYILAQEYNIHFVEPEERQLVL